MISGEFHLDNESSKAVPCREGFFGKEAINSIYTCAMVKSRYIRDGHPTFNRNPYNGYINPYYWVDDHPLLYGNNGSLDPGTYTHGDYSSEN